MNKDKKFCPFKLPDPKSKHFDLDVYDLDVLKLARPIFSVTKVDQNEFYGKPALANK